MDIIKNPPYEKLQEIYSQYFSLSYLGNDINTKFALISLVCYITKKAKEKKSDVTEFSILRQIVKDTVPEDYLKGLAVICSDFSYQCDNFPTFDLKPKEMVEKVREILNNWLPF